MQSQVTFLCSAGSELLRLSAAFDKHRVQLLEANYTTATLPCAQTCRLQGVLFVAGRCPRKNDELASKQTTAPTSNKRAGYTLLRQRVFLPDRRCAWIEATELLEATFEPVVNRFFRSLLQKDVTFEPTRRFLFLIEFIAGLNGVRQRFWLQLCFPRRSLFAGRRLRTRITETSFPRCRAARYCKTSMPCAKKLKQE